MQSDYLQLDAASGNLASAPDKPRHCWCYAAFLAASCLLVGPLVLLWSLSGGHRDMHGCIPSAGYTWCETKAMCIQPWEHGIHDDDAMTRKCESAHLDTQYEVDSAKLSFLGGDRDPHGCIPSAGYAWCAKRSECIRKWKHGIHDDAEMTAKCGDAARSRTSANLQLSYMCHCPPAEVIYPCTAEQHRELLNGTTCPYYARHEPSHAEASVSAGCPTCNTDETSLSCRACQNGVSEKHFCELCGSQGLNDVGCTKCSADQQKSYKCNCPPAEVIYPCTANQYHDLMSGTTCPYYATQQQFQPTEKSYRCNCPPTEVIYPCTAEEHHALLSGTTCQYYKDHPTEKSYMCNCPPIEVIYPCTAEEHHALLSGTTCQYYKDHPTSP